MLPSVVEGFSSSFSSSSDVLIATCFALIQVAALSINRRRKVSILNLSALLILGIVFLNIRILFVFVILFYFPFALKNKLVTFDIDFICLCRNLQSEMLQ